MNLMLVYIFVFIFGAIIGSFLNVIVLRYNTGESFLTGSSRCFACGKKLKWHENIPLISFIIQKGRCSGCGSKISWQYPLVELLTGAVFLSIFLITNYSLLITSYYFIIFSLLIIISAYDIKHQIIPNSFVYSFIILSFLSALSGLDFITGLIFFAFFALLWFASSGKAMGFGDAKLALGIGWLLGFSKGLLAILLAFWSGAIVGILLLLFFKKRYNIKSKVPFGPFLVFGAMLSFLVGNKIINLYLNF